MPEHVFRNDPADEYYFEEGCYILEYLNHPADPHASIARARVPPATSTRPHRLIDTTERYLILSGQGSARVGTAEAVPVTAGDVVLIPPGVSQHVTNVSVDQDLVFLAVCTPRFRLQNYQQA
jgi:mannose-6-phosphate isomerase-like protein (cupin superfamily)